MKRLIISSLLACMLVGQVSAAAHDSDNTKLVKGMVFGAGMTGMGTGLGLTLACLGNGMCVTDLDRAKLWIGLPVAGALAGSIGGIVYAKRNVQDAHEQKGIIIGAVATPLVGSAVLIKLASMLADFVPQFRK